MTAPAPSAATVDTGAAVFVLSDAITFVALLGASAALKVLEPPARMATPLQLAVLTALLFAGSATFGIARRLPRLAYLLLAAFGLAFVVGEALEWRALLAHGLGPACDLRHASLFVVTGLHALHVLIGAVVALVISARRDRARAGRVLSWYWAALDVAWLAILLVVYS